LDEKTVDGGVSQIVCIIGMHRSGTSCLTGSLEEAGLYLGDVITTTPHNLKGTRENRRVFRLHDSVLLYSGGTWKQPPEDMTWSDSHRSERDSIIQSYFGVPAWGFKDPRTVLLLGLWQERLANLQFVGTLRHPRHVVESLCRREGGSMDHWFDLWVNYNERMLALYDSAPFPIVSFDLGEEAYRRSLMVVAGGLGLKTPACTTFFDPALRHYRMSSPCLLPERVSRVYNSLCKIALDP
jgi:hypothetical protein